MAQILTPHVYDDCEAIVEKYGCVVWDLKNLSTNPNYLDLFEDGVTNERTEAQMLASGLSKAFLDDFATRVANLWIDIYSSHQDPTFSIVRPMEVSHNTTYALTRFSTIVYYKTAGYTYKIERVQNAGSDEYVYKFTKSDNNA